MWTISTFPKTKFISWEDWHYFIILQISSMSGIIEGNWTHLSTSAFNPLPYVVLVEVNEENGTLKFVVEKNKIYLIAFSDNCRYYSLTLY